ncbi:hypothetical protein ER308_02515 [Egibacter rhizosphaerae]|uniref:VOC domain-containing protein n=1 Tax=Egibacter rhizosphaerae TaxID=1670831 RepID=A0A411YBH7_9ACTN|nr:VOC family protein [Egibacter rhizosphaerae]QBI18546.1 hypothetical protein ER308_02515 [Egibacter rhizosphaerae]
MQWRLHHVNLPAPDVARSAEFFGKIFDHEPESFPVADEDDRGSFDYTEQGLALMRAPDRGGEMHICRPSATVARDNGWHINPLVSGHIALEVDDIEEVKRQLVEMGEYYVDAGPWAMQGYQQIYFHDPGMNVIEVNQRTD